MKIGAQLFTLREFCKTPQDFAQTLSRVADIGYTEVQVSGTCDYDAQWLAAELKKNGLTCCVTHIPTDKLQNNLEAVIADHKAFGTSHIGIGALPNGWNGINEEIYNTFVGIYREIGQKIHDAGLQFMYHNHDIEFQQDANGKTYFSRILEDFSAEQLGVTLDTYWVQAGGGDVVDWMRRLRGRIPCVHLKDMRYFPGEGKRMAPVGFGNMNFAGILAAAEEAQCKHLLVEQDNCYDEDPFDCLKQSYQYLKSMGLN